MSPYSSGGGSRVSVVEKRMRRREPSWCFFRELGDDLLVEILIRLPSKTVVRCKAVCKKWFTLIGEEGDFFIRRYIHYRHDLQVNLKCVSLVFQTTCTYLPLPPEKKLEWLVEVNIASENPVVRKLYKDGVVDMRFLPCVQQPFPSIIRNLRLDLRFEASCGELLLCSYDNTFTCTTVYYICNVATKKWVALPPIPTGGRGESDVGFLCDPMPCSDCELESNVRYNYKLVRIPIVSRFYEPSFLSELKIQMFCSKEGRWRNSTLSLSRIVKEPRMKNQVIACNRMLHRLTDDGVMAFDPFCETLVSRIIDLPPGESIDSERCCFGVSGDRVRLGIVSGSDAANLMLLVWELVDYSNVKWCLALRVGNLRSFVRGLGLKGSFTLKILAFHPYTRDILYLSVGKYIIKCNVGEEINKFKVLHEVIAINFHSMIKFYGNSDTAEIYVMNEEVVAPEVSTMPGSRSSRTTLAEPPPAPADVTTDMIVNDINEPDLQIDPTFDVVVDTSHVDAHFDVAIERPARTRMPIPISFVGYDEKDAKAAEHWQNIITGVGQRFNSVTEFRDALRKYAHANQFAFKYKKNDSHRVSVKCKADGCPWRIYASRLVTTQLICIKKMNPTHTCEGSTLSSGIQATRSWVASIVKDKLKVFPNYKPKDIVKDVREEYGIQLNYFQAWRGKEIAKEQLQGSYKEAYSKLPFFCEKIMETNPGSLATFTTKEDSSFHRLFVSFHASLYGFEQGCRPLLFLDGIFLKSKYQGTLLVATAADGNDGVFPVAFAIVDTESDDNWHWFLLQLKTALSVCRGITFVADREKGLKESIADIFQNDDVYHSFCLTHLSEQFIRDLKGQFSHEVKRLMVEDFYGAAHATTPEGFQRCVESIKNISIDAYNWIMQSEPVHWANAFFPGARYNHMTSNFGELFHGWLSDVHELPIIQMVDAIRGKIMELIYARQTESSHWQTRLTPAMEEKLEKENIKVRALYVIVVGNRYEVRGDTIETVDVDNCVCSCKEWQLTGLPCCHAIAVIIGLQRDPYDYCSRYFTTNNYRVTYSQSINPVSNIDGPWQKASSQLAVSVTPPPTRRPPGRPTTKKIGSQDAGKRQLQCSRCKGSGHNKSSCKEFLLE